MGILSRGYCAVENMASQQGFGAEARIGDPPGAGAGISARSEPKPKNKPLVGVGARIGKIGAGIN